MVSYYKLQIRFSSNIKTYNSITDILNTIPKVQDFSDFADNIPNTWIHEVINNHEDAYYDFINNFCDILENKYEELAKLGISRNNITIWLLYEYNQQCNMEFDPKKLKRLGENGISFCISCWESGGYITFE